jgi:hypothetical protein
MNKTIFNDQSGDVKKLEYGEVMGKGIGHVFILLVLLPIFCIYFIWVAYDKLRGSGDPK